KWLIQEYGKVLSDKKEESGAQGRPRGTADGGRHPARRGEVPDVNVGVGPVSEDDLSRSPYPAGGRGRRVSRNNHRTTPTISRTMGGTSRR
ncbi:unnamed protein product, partial [Ectocarpus fasciculatus]